MSLTVQQGIQYVKTQLSDLYPAMEIQSFQRLLFMHLLNCKAVDIYVNYTKILSDLQEKSLFEMVHELARYKPLQYILGTTEFYGLSFKVSPDVLIPRPETEELVDWIIKDNSNRAASILDIGTGSGCIAVSVAKNLSQASVMAMDISDKALLVAGENAKQNNVHVELIQDDILHANLSLYGNIDIIVSNPPYIARQEMKEMSANVLDFEPHIALFVEDAEPLIFYKSIISFAKQKLVSHGKIYFEINEAYGKMLTIVLESNNFCNIVLRNDINGKQRMISADYGF